MLKSSVSNLCSNAGSDEHEVKAGGKLFKACAATIRNAQSAIVEFFVHNDQRCILYAIL